MSPLFMATQSDEWLVDKMCARADRLDAPDGTDNVGWLLNSRLAAHQEGEGWAR